MTNEEKVMDALYRSYQLLGSEEYAIFSYYRSLAEQMRKDDVKVGEINDGELFSKVYHGSGASFDRFDHSFMGTGEGAQAFGWGTYVTDVEGIGKHYAKAMRDNKISEKHKENAVINNLARQTLASNNGDKNAALDELRNLLNESWSDKKRVKAQIKIIETGKFLPESKVKANLYTVEIPDDNGSNYLRWKADNNQETIDKLNEAYRNMLLERGVEEEDINPDFAPFSTGVSGESIYKIFARELGSDKNASEFLNRQGFVGISYPAEAMTGGRADNARNYVIFNENDAQIEEHIRFSKGPKLSKKEREILREEVMKNNNLYGKNKPIETAFTANNFYIYNNFGNDDFSVIRRIKIEGNEDLINDLYNEVQNGTNEDTKNISRTIKEVIRRRRLYNSNNSNAKGERRNDGGYVDLDLRESSERGADNAEGNRNERQTNLGRGYVKTNLDGTNGPRYVPEGEGETPLFSRNTTDDIIKELISKGEITFTDEQGNPCAACGMGGVKGTKWEIVKDFNGMPKHSQGGVDIMLTDNGVRIIRDGGEIECKNGLFINSYEE